jgi:hypothetical protein
MEVIEYDFVDTSESCAILGSIDHEFEFGMTINPRLFGEDGTFLRGAPLGMGLPVS